MSGGPDTFYGESSEQEEHAGFYSWVWQTEPKPKSALTKNPNGVTGWGIILNTTNAAHKPGDYVKIHLCAHNPCTAVHSAAKHAYKDIPIHIQQTPKPVDTTEVVEPPGSVSSPAVIN